MKLTNAKLMNKKHPTTFEIPTEKELSKVDVGTLVKLIFDGKERMWVKVIKRDNNNFEGILDNDPFNLPIKSGDKVKFKKDNITDIY